MQIRARTSAEHRWRMILAGGLILSSMPTAAQRVDDNATAQAEDAFGINISGQNLGLYDPSNVRGFSPTAAGNIRLDGLYIDQQANFTSRLVGGYRILVGPSVLGHPFPAPSGIADYKLRRPGKRDLLSISAQGDSSDGGLLELDGQAHDLLPGLGMTGGAGVYRNKTGRGGGNRVFSLGTTALWQPTSSMEIVPFFSRIAIRENLSEPITLLAGDSLPPPLETTRFLGQRWARGVETSMNYGLIGKAQMGAWLLRAGIFRSQDSSPISYQPLFTDASPSGFAGRGVISDRGDFAAATSGELQLSRTIDEGPRKHRFYLAAWGRDQQLRYGATDVEMLSPGLMKDSGAAAMPTFSFGPQTGDHVRQLTIGAAYEGAWSDLGSVNAGVQRTEYRKQVSPPDVVLPVSRASPWLYNLAGAIKVLETVTVYAGVSHGLEESSVAPSIALNRNAAPPAIRTSQVDGGIRWAVDSHVSLVADLFSIQKPYYDLDASRIFRSLGTVEHRGVEVSLAGSPMGGLSIVAGAILLDSTVSGEQVYDGVVGRRPVGFSPSIAIASIDYQLPNWKALSLDADFERDGRRTATIDDQLVLPVSTSLNVGMRYHFKLSGRAAVLRLQAQNVTNAFAYGIVGNGALLPKPPRQVLARVTVDV